MLLLEHDVPHSKFSEEVLSFLPKLPWSITEEVSSNTEPRVEYPLSFATSLHSIVLFDALQTLHAQRMH